MRVGKWIIQSFQKALECCDCYLDRRWWSTNSRRLPHGIVEQGQLLEVFARWWVPKRHSTLLPRLFLSLSLAVVLSYHRRGRLCCLLIGVQRSRFLFVLVNIFSFSFADQPQRSRRRRLLRDAANQRKEKMKKRNWTDPARFGDGAKSELAQPRSSRLTCFLSFFSIFLKLLLAPRGSPKF